MNDKIKNLYEKMTILGSMVYDKSEFRVALRFDDVTSEDLVHLTVRVSCNKYAQFLINDFKSLVNKHGEEIYDMFDRSKLCALFCISETHSWFSRKDLVSFLEFEIDNMKLYD